MDVSTSPTYILTDIHLLQDFHEVENAKCLFHLPSIHIEGPGLWQMEK